MGMCQLKKPTGLPDKGHAFVEEWTSYLNSGQRDSGELGVVGRTGRERPLLLIKARIVAPT